MSLAIKLAAPLALLTPFMIVVGAGAQTAPAGQAGSTAPVRTETVVYDNWVVTCRDRLEKGSKKTCSASMQIKDSKSNNIVLVWQVGRNPAGEPTHVIRTPLGVRLKDGVQVALGGGKPRKLDYASCSQQGCEAIAPFEDGLSKELAGAKEAVVSFTLANGQAINVTVPLNGVDKALPALKG